MLEVVALSYPSSSPSWYPLSSLSAGRTSLSPRQALVLEPLFSLSEAPSFLSRFQYHSSRCRKPPPAPQTCTNGVQNSELNDEDLNPEADEVDSFEQYIDNLFAASEAQKHKGCKTTEFWDVKTIKSDGTIKQAHLRVKEAMKPPNGRKIVLRKCSILMKIMGGIIKRTILKMLGRAWKETRNRLYHEHDHYDSQLTIKQNIKGRPPWITADHWRWYLDYHNSEDAKKKCRKNAVNQSKQLYTHISRSKILARLGEEEERIAEIEQHDESSRLLSQNDSLAQALGKEHLGRVRGMGTIPTSSQVFVTNSHQPSNGA